MDTREWHGVEYRYRPGRNRKWAWRCECGITGMNKTETQAYLAVAGHLERATARMRGGRPVGLVGVLRG